MTDLFSRGELRDFLSQRITRCVQSLERLTEDEVLARSTDDLVAELVELARIEPIVISPDAVDGRVAETQIERVDRFEGRRYATPGFMIQAVFEYSGDPALLQYRPSTRLMTTFDAKVMNGTIVVSVEQAGASVDPAATQKALDSEIGPIREMAAYAGKDAQAHNSGLERQLRPAVERRKRFLQDRRELAGALGFPLRKRMDAPTPVPLERTVVGVKRSEVRSERPPFRDEPALSEAQYEDAVTVISSALLSMERTPSVVAGKDEEDLRDYILVMLNGTFQGAATGETFVKSGKTDVLIRVDDRHVFVGECKRWTGSKALGAAIDQLLGYLPWRDEKAALIVFIDNKDASAVFDKIDVAVKAHVAHKRIGKASPDRTKRTNYILGHPEDREREIQLAVLCAVMSAGSAK